MITLERILISFTAPMINPDQFDRWAEATKEKIAQDPDIHDLVKPEVKDQLERWKAAVRKTNAEATPA
jgi:hypothetical protein